jgi:hypothetical protein
MSFVCVERMKRFKFPPPLNPIEKVELGTQMCDVFKQQMHHGPVCRVRVVAR